MLGIFDSGSGGLTVLREIRKLLPEVEVVYFGDLKNAPYGEKSAEEIGVLTALGIERLLQEGATQIVSACNSASANIVVPLFESIKIKPVEIIEMAGPTVKTFRSRKDERILLVATEATTRSGIYQEAFRSGGIEIQTLALPHLARAIEEANSGPAILGMIGEALEKYNGTFDTLILACTHYPLVIDYFRRSVPKGVEIFDPAEAVAKEVAKKYSNSQSGLSANSCELADKDGGEMKFLISKESGFFRAKVEEFWGNEKYSVDVLG